MLVFSAYYSFAHIIIFFAPCNKPMDYICFWENSKLTKVPFPFQSCWPLSNKGCWPVYKALPFALTSLLAEEVPKVLSYPQPGDSFDLQQSAAGELCDHQRFGLRHPPLRPLPSKWVGLPTLELSMRKFLFPAKKYCMLLKIGRSAWFIM